MNFPFSRQLLWSNECNGDACECQAQQESWAILDLSSIVSQNLGSKIVVNCSGQQYSGGECFPGSIQISVLQPKRAKDGTYWPAPFDGPCKMTNGTSCNAFGSLSALSSTQCNMPNWGTCGADVPIRSLSQTGGAFLLFVSPVAPPDGTMCFNSFCSNGGTLYANLVCAVGVGN